MSSDIEDFFLSCTKFSSYPHNLLHHDLLGYCADEYSKRLQMQSESLFVKSKAWVEFLDFEYGGQDELKVFLRAPLMAGNYDPQCRIIFLLAPHSRAALKITHDMFQFLLTYHDVMPSFLDFVFPFGYQKHARDSQFSGFREDSRVELSQRSARLMSIGRSGRALRICYNLRCVERSPCEVDLKWSIRQTAVYHSFDLETGHSLWINIKGNDVFKNRITEASKKPSTSKVSTPRDAFVVSLDTHIWFCDWSAENWRWYINELEDDFQRLTTNVLVITVDYPTTPNSIPAPATAITGPQADPLSPLSRRSTLQSWMAPQKKSVTYSPPVLSPSSTFAETPNINDDAGDSHWTGPPWTRDSDLTNPNESPWSLLPYLKGLKTLSTSCTFVKKEGPVEGTSNTCTDDGTNPAPELVGQRRPPSDLPPELSEMNDPDSLDKFSIRDLQRVEFVEEKVQEAFLVLGNNIEVLEALKQHYQYVASHAELSEDYQDMHADLTRFCRRVTRIEKDLNMLRSRASTLLQLIANRKGLLSSIIQFKSVKLNESFARRTQQSADNMERFNAEMNDIAHKTKQETVSMRVITSVTLFFLPATFIATFMSTDILSFKEGNQELRLQGLKIYLAIALPMTAVTFFAWFIIYRLAKRDRSLRQWQHTSAALSSA